MRQCRRHFAERREPRHMDEFGLQLLQPLLGLLPLGEIANEAGEETAAARITASPTESSIGKVAPSLRCPTTMRPMPMMWRSPVRK